MMKNKKALGILLFILATLAIPIVSAQSTAQVSPGVTKGDVFDYKYDATWKSTDSNMAVPNLVAGLVQTESFEIAITDVSGTTITATVTSTYKNGTTTSQSGFIDVESGSIHIPFGFLIVGANLNANDKVYPTGGDATINSTTSRNYPSGNRSTNEQIITTTSENHQDQTDIYYDKAKGVAVSSHYQSTDTYPTETETFTETITSTNANTWTAASLTSPTDSSISTSTAPSSIPPTSIQTSDPNTITTQITGQISQTPQLPSLMVILVIVVVIVVSASAALVMLRKRKTQSVFIQATSFHNI